MDKWTIIGPSTPFKGGIAQHTTELAHRLRATGADVMIESWRRQYPQRLYPGDAQTAHDDYPPYERVHRSMSWNQPMSWFAAGWRIRRRQGRVILVGVTPFQFPIYMVILAVAGRSLRQKSVLIAHNVTPHESSRTDRLLTTWMYRCVRGVLAHSPAEAHRAQQFGATAMHELLPLHFDADPRRRTSPERQKLLAFIGFVRPYKGLDLLIEALARSRSGFRLEVLGEFWSDAEVFRLQAERLGIAEYCEFRAGYGTSHDVTELLDRADALVLPYRSATSSQLPRLAFLRGTPVVATDVGDFSCQVRHNVDGVVCDPDSASLANALTTIADDHTWNRLRTGVVAPTIEDEWLAYLSTICQCLSPGRGG